MGMLVDNRIAITKEDVLKLPASIVLSASGRWSRTKYSHIWFARSGDDWLFLSVGQTLRDDFTGWIAQPHESGALALIKLHHKGISSLVPEPKHWTWTGGAHHRRLMDLDMIPDYINDYGYPGS